MKRAAPDVWNCVGQVVVGLDYEFVGARYGQEQGEMVLRVFIDNDRGIDVDDCAEVSRQLSAVLDVEDLLSTAYTLEVSSPGLDRPLFDEKDFIRFSGTEVALKLLTPQMGRRRFKGPLIGCQNNEIEIEVDGEHYFIPLEKIDNANLVLPAQAYKSRNLAEHSA